MPQTFVNDSCTNKPSFFNADFILPFSHEIMYINWSFGKLDLFIELFASKMEKTKYFRWSNVFLILTLLFNVIEASRWFYIIAHNNDEQQK